MPNHSSTTIGTIGLPDTGDLPRPDADPQDLASTFKWLVGDADQTATWPTARHARRRVDSGSLNWPATPVHVKADLDTIYSQLDELLQRLIHS